MVVAEAVKAQDCDKVVQLLKIHGRESEEVASQGCAAVNALAANGANNVKLGAIGGCEVVVDALSQWGKISKPRRFYDWLLATGVAKYNLRRK
jgi:hypothetical protein